MQPFAVGKIQQKRSATWPAEVSRRPHRLLHVTTRICWQIRRKKRACVCVCVWCVPGSWDHVRPPASLRLFQGRPGALSFGETQKAAPVGLAPMPHRRSVYLMQLVAVGRIEQKCNATWPTQVSRRPHRVLHADTRICWQIRRKKRACVCGWCCSRRWDHVRPLASLRVFRARPGALSLGKAQPAAPVGHGGKLKTSRRAWRRRRQAHLLVFSLPPRPTGAPCT